jgi:hypothetical protein
VSSLSAIGLIGVSFDGVTRRDGGGALQRSAYQMGMEYGSSKQKERGGDSVQHLRQWLLLPETVDPNVWTREKIWTEAAAAENRQDAREGRFFDLTWPRELPTALMETVVDALYKPFVEMGLPVQVDAERSLAADGLSNDHLHGLIGTRELSNEGFAPKECREVDAWFTAGVRRHVAEVLNHVAEAADLQVRFDPRPNEEWEYGLPPEDFVPRWRTRNASSGSAVSRQNAHRRLRREYRDVFARIETLRLNEVRILAEIQSELAAMTFLTSAQAGEMQRPIEVELLARALDGWDVERPFTVPGIGTALVVGDTVIADTGTRIVIDGPIIDQSGKAALLLAGCKGWRDLSLVDGTGMPLPLSMIQGGRPRRQKAEVPGAVRLCPEAIVAAAWLAERLESSSNDRKEILGRVQASDNPALHSLAERLAKSGTTEAAVTAEAWEEVLGNSLNELDLWPRYRLERDLAAMLVPGHALSREFVPPAGFAERYLHGGPN